MSLGRFTGKALPKVGDLLSARPLVRAASRDEMARALERAYAVRDVDFESDEAPFEAVANRAALGDVQLHFCRYDLAARVAFSDMAGFRQMFGMAGAGELRLGGQGLPIDAASSAIVPPSCDFTGAYGRGYAHLVVQYDEAALRRKWELMSGAGAQGRFSLPVLQTLPAARTANTRALAVALAGQFSRPGPVWSVAVTELIQALITIFLQDQDAGPEGLAHPPSMASPTAAARLADYIHTHWRQPLTVESIAAACGVSVRSVFAQFRQRYDVSPMTYLRNVRLDQARLILSANPAESVIDVAMACGFHSLGHFARRYRERFGELPSATLQEGLKRRLAAT